MSFRPDAVRGGQTGGSERAGRVSYRLARNAVVSEFQKGRLSRIDVCDAHPDLLRAARGVGQPRAERCPICAESDVVFVSYVFGSGLPPSGRCVTTAAELAKLDRRAADLACYVVEVCPECSWNHLAHTFLLGTGRAPAP